MKAFVLRFIQSMTRTSIGYDEFDITMESLDYTATDESHFKALLNVILEPSLIPFYTAIDTEFVNRYIVNNK